MGSGRIIVTHSDQAVGLHLSQWKTQPSASLTPDEVRELIDRLQKALAKMKEADRADFIKNPITNTIRAIKAAIAADEDDDFSDIA